MIQSRSRLFGQIGARTTAGHHRIISAIPTNDLKGEYRQCIVLLKYFAMRFFTATATHRQMRIVELPALDTHSND